MATPTAPPGAMEGMEATESAFPAVAIAGHSPAKGHPVGQQQHRTLAHGWFASALTSSPKRLLGTAWSGWFQFMLAAATECLVNRRMRARTSGGVGGDGGTPPPTLFLRRMGYWGHLVLARSKLLLSELDAIGVLGRSHDETRLPDDWKFLRIAG